MSLKIRSSAPVFRSFDTGLARAFYVDWLGVTWDGEHRIQPRAPAYVFLRLGAFDLHLSARHGDPTPGATALVFVEGLRGMRRSRPIQG